MEDIGRDGLSSETEAKVNQLVEKATILISLDKEDPTKEEKMLTFISETEVLREEFGNFCETVGEGADRVIIFRSPVERKADEAMVIDRGTSFGTFHSTYKEYLFASRKGLAKLVFTLDQEAEIDPSSSVYQYKSRADGSVISPTNTPEQTEVWADGNRAVVQKNGAARIRDLERIMQSHTFPQLPVLPDPKWPTKRSEEQIQAFHEQEKAFMIGESLKPEPAAWLVSHPISDVDFDARNSLTGFMVGAFRGSPQVTKPDFVTKAIRENVKQATPLRQPLASS